MINKENIPKGKCEVYDSIHLIDYAVHNYSRVVCDDIETHDEAEFIAEAFNVFNKTGMTPEELSKSQKTNYEIAKSLTEKENEYLEQIEQLQQENDEQRRLLKKIEYGIASSIKNDIPVSVFMQQQLKNIQSLTTQQEEKPFGHDAPYDPRAV